MLKDCWIHGVFCTDIKDKRKPQVPTATIDNGGIIRTKDLMNWERLPDLISNSRQQRNVVLRPEFVEGKYALYTPSAG
jgi:4-O-beta-D-mannosyl-D-glucose phosphorylase